MEVKKRQRCIEIRIEDREGSAKYSKRWALKSPTVGRSPEGHVDHRGAGGGSVNNWDVPTCRLL
jgi:hypothetical protein